MKRGILFVVPLLLLAGIVFAEDYPYGGVVSIPAMENENARQLATPLGAVYIGMPKEDLYEIFAPLHEQNRRREGAEEWITFSDWTTDEFGDVITFHIVDNKVKGWQKERAALSSVDELDI